MTTLMAACQRDSMAELKRELNAIQTSDQWRDQQGDEVLDWVKTSGRSHASTLYMMLLAAASRLQGAAAMRSELAPSAGNTWWMLNIADPLLGNRYREQLLIACHEAGLFTAGNLALLAGNQRVCDVVICWLAANRYFNPAVHAQERALRKAALSSAVIVGDEAGVREVARSDSTLPLTHELLVLAAEHGWQDLTWFIESRIDWEPQAGVLPEQRDYHVTHNHALVAAAASANEGFWSAYCDARLERLPAQVIIDAMKAAITGCQTEYRKGDAADEETLGRYNAIMQSIGAAECLGTIEIELNWFLGRVSEVDAHVLSRCPWFQQAETTQAIWRAIEAREPRDSLGPFDVQAIEFLLQFCPGMADQWEEVESFLRRSGADQDVIDGLRDAHALGVVGSNGHQQSSNQTTAVRPPNSSGENAPALKRMRTIDPGETASAVLMAGEDGYGEVGTTPTRGGNNRPAGLSAEGLRALHELHRSPDPRRRSTHHTDDPEEEEYDDDIVDGPSSVLSGNGRG